MTEAQIADLIIRHRWTERFMLPRFTPHNWWECDVFEVSKSGYWTEYEIKLTVQDFRADAKKQKNNGIDFTDGKLVRVMGEKKHDLLSQSSPHGPVRFFYVTPAGMLTREMLPTWAGLMEVQSIDGSFQCQTVIEAPRLHKQKVDEKVLAYARETCYWRMHRLLADKRRKEREVIDAHLQP